MERFYLLLLFFARVKCPVNNWLSLKLHVYVNRQANISWPFAIWNKNKTNRKFQSPNLFFMKHLGQLSPRLFPSYSPSFGRKPKLKSEGVETCRMAGLANRFDRLQNTFKLMSPLRELTLDVLITKFSTPTPKNTFHYRSAKCHIFLAPSPAMIFKPKLFNEEISSRFWRSDRNRTVIML